MKWFKKKSKKDSGNVQEVKTSQAKKSKSSKNFPERFFSVENRPKIHKSFVIACFLMISFILGKLVGSLLNSVVPIKEVNIAGSSEGSNTLGSNQSLNYLQKITQVDLFKANGAQKITEDLTPKPVVDEGPCEKADGSSGLPITLLNTIVLQDEVKSIAAVQVRSKSDPLEVRIGDKIDDLAKVSKIQRLSMVIKNLKNGKCESVTSKKLDEAPAKLSVLPPSSVATAPVQGIDRQGNDFTLKRSIIQEKLKDISSILTQARAVPLNNPDGTMSFRIVEIEPGSIYSHLDIQNGDSISKINGRPIKNLNQVMGLFGKLKSNLSSLKLTVVRDGVAQDRNYDFTD